MKFITISILLLSVAPLELKAQAIGYYNDGRLQNAASLPVEGGCGWRHLHAEFLVLFEDMKRIWGTSELVDMIQKTAFEMQSRFPDCDNLQVEDLSAEQGGDIPRHGSHENGLDADLGFYKANCQEHIATRENLYAPDMVLANGSISPNFDLERNWELMKTLHKHGDVNRIFVDQKLKDALCVYARNKGELSEHSEVLRSLRHVNNHKDHLHIRLNCPANSTNCRSQAPPPAGHGCEF